MKPKGWRLDPAWVEHYSKIDRERLDRQIQRIKFEHEIEQNRMAVERSLRFLKMPTVKIV